MWGRNPIIFHSLAAKFGTLAMDLDIARSVGFDGIEVSGKKLADYLDAGFSQTELSSLMRNIYVPGVGFLMNIERQGRGRDTLLEEAEELFSLAALAGAKGVQVITGPVNVEAVRAAHRGETTDLYSGLLGKPLTEQINLTAANLARLADLAGKFGLLLYLESLSWTPLNTLEKQLQVIERAERSNIRLVIDVWHCFTSGDTPDTVAKLDKDLIYGVHLCDSLPYDGGIPDEPVLRDVSTGEGVIDLPAWVEAVKATGYEGWWSCELFCRKDHQRNSYDVAARLHKLMLELVDG
jgi:sugar phosphate isomerase/epimerase